MRRLVLSLLAVALTVLGSTARADGVNDAGDLMAGDGRRHDVLLPVRVNTHIGPADRAGADLDPNLARPALGHGHALHLDVLGSEINRRSHAIRQRTPPFRTLNSNL